MSKRSFFLFYGVLSLALITVASLHYFTHDKNLWWFACLLSGLISGVYTYFQLFKKVEEESFVNFIVSIFLVTSFLISLGLVLYQDGNETIPIVLAGINAGIWLFYSIFLAKKWLKKG